MCGDVEEGGGDEAGDLPLGGVISAHLHRVARQQRPAALPHPRLAPGDILVDIPVDIPVSLSLLHSHTCFIYEANMRHIGDKYAAFMMQISIIFKKK